MKKSLTRRSFLQGAGLASVASRTATVLGSPLHYTQTGPSPPGKPFLGRKLSDPFIAITTNSLSRRGSFRNTALELVRAYGTDGKEIPIVVASHRSVWGRVRDFRAGGLEFDGGIGAIPVTLDVNNRLQNCTTCSAQGRSDCLGAITLYPEFPHDLKKTAKQGRLAFFPGMVEGIRSRAKQLGLI